ncbi:MAG: hypothetical protein ABF296_09935 [Oceanococcaceae bacterium]
MNLQSLASTLALSGILCTGTAVAFEPQPGDLTQNRALYQHTMGNHLESILTLMTATDTDADRGLFTTHALLSYGLYNAAEQRFLQMLAAGELSRDERADLYLRLSRYAFERGYDDAAAATLQAMEDDLGNTRFYDRELLAAMVAGRRGELDDSIRRLDNRRVSGRTNFGKYNLAMALYAAGDDRGARANLDQIGRELVSDPLEHALRDQANLTLAYDYLRTANGSAALPILQRIRLDGPFSEKALLALGWAELSTLAAESIRLAEGQTSDTIGGVLGAILAPGKVNEDLRQRLGMLRARRDGDDQTLRYRRAINAWQTLAQRDVRQTAVLEVEVALPWALSQLGETEAAQRYYKVGIARLQTASDRVDSAIAAVRDGRMFETLIRNKPDQFSGWAWRATELADADETWYLAELLASSTFQEALKNYRDLRQLERRLNRERADLERGRSGLLASVSADILIRRERSAFTEPLFPGLSPQLQMATTLGAFPRNETLEGLLSWTYRFNPKHALTLTRGLGQIPDGEDPALRAVLTEIDALVADIRSSLPQQRALLNDLALKTLNEQRDAIRKYLVEARFSLARLFDAGFNLEESTP